MSKLDDLIKKLCPNGVEYKELGEVCEFNRGKSITSKTAIDGDVPVISGGKKPAFYHNVSNRNANCITVAGSGVYAGFINFWDIPIFCADSFSVDVKDFTLMNVKYIYYFLKDKQNLIYSFKKGAGIAHVYGKDLSKIKIPIPPKEIQEEIVRILDSFTELEKELEDQLKKEFENRKKQYEFYRDSLLTFGDDVEWKNLGDIGEVERGNGLTKKDFKDKGVPCIHYGQIYTYYGTFADETISFVSEELGNKLKKVNNGDLIIAITSENYEDVCKPLVWLGKDYVVTGGHTAIFRHTQNPKYIAYYLQTSMFFWEKRKIVHGTKVMEVTPKKLENIKIPIPPLSEQERIVSILDKFDALCNDISEGLPAEIEKRKKQYEYYREKLLNFKNISENN